MKVRRAGRVAWREIGGETFVLDTERGLIYGLAAPAARLWDVLDGDCDLGALENALPEEPGRRATVLALVRELDRLGLVACDGATSAADSDGSGQPRPAVVAWQEELTSFGFSCALHPATTPACTQVPTH